jgi:O-antigen/teichoic acid export membrane protein
MTLGQRIRSGVAWLLFGNTGSQVLNFLFGIALARLLVPADFGMIATIQIVTGIVSLVSSGGMSQSLVRARQASEHDFQAIFTIQLGIGVLICAGIFVIAPWFARFFGNPLYVDLLAISALNFLLRPFALIRSAWLNREMNFRGTAAANLTTSLVSQAASVAMAWAGMGVWSLSVGGLVAALTSNVMLYRLVPLRLALRFDRAVARQHAAFGFNMTALDLISHVRTQSINLVMSKLAGPSFLGLFNKAENLARMPNRLITPATGQVVFRALAKVADDVDQSKYIFYRTITLLSVYAFPFLVGLIFIAEPLIVFLYGERWRPAAEPMAIAALGGFFLTTLRPCAVLLEAQNRLRQEMAVVAVTTVFAVAGCYVGLRWGLAGVAWSTVLAHAVGFVLMYSLVVRAIPTRLADLGRALAPALVLNALLAAVLAAVHYLAAPLRTTSPLLYLCAMGAAGGMTYGCAFLFLPIEALQSEAARWRGLVSASLGRLRPRKR